MSTRETTAILDAQDVLTGGIKEEMREQNGKAYPFGFTENLFYLGGRVWHEFKMTDDNTLLYGFVDDRDGVHVVQDLDEARDFSFPW
jgi:hypothetical protein